MKTIKEINEEIMQLSESLRIAPPNKKERIKKQIEQLRQCRIYVESRPGEEYLKKEIDRLSGIIKSLKLKSTGFIRDNTGKYKNPETVYNKLVGLDILKKQLKALKYITE